MVFKKAMKQFVAKNTPIIILQYFLHVRVANYGCGCWVVIEYGIFLSFLNFSNFKSFFEGVWKYQNFKFWNEIFLFLNREQ